MTDKNLRNANLGNKEKRKNRPAPEDSKWRLTCMNLGKGKELKGLDAGENTVDTNNKKFLEEIGFKQNEKGQLTLKVGNNRIESEIVNGKKIVHKRIGEDGKVLYEDKTAIKDEVR